MMPRKNKKGIPLYHVRRLLSMYSHASATAIAQELIPPPKKKEATDTYGHKDIRRETMSTDTVQLNRTCMHTGWRVHGI